MVSFIEQFKDLFVFAFCKKGELCFAVAKNWGEEITVVLSEKLRKQFETKRSITLTWSDSTYFYSTLDQIIAFSRARGSYRPYGLVFTFALTLSSLFGLRLTPLYAKFGRGCL